MEYRATTAPRINSSALPLPRFECIDTVDDNDLISLVTCNNYEQIPFICSEIESSKRIDLIDEIKPHKLLTTHKKVFTSGPPGTGFEVTKTRIWLFSSRIDAELNHSECIFALREHRTNPAPLRRSGQSGEVRCFIT